MFGMIVYRTNNFQTRGNMLDRTKSVPFERRHMAHRSDHRDYIKICVPEETEMPASVNVSQQDVRGEQRFTFSRQWQDAIKEEEEEEEFCRVDWQELIKLRKDLEAAKTQNHRLMMESGENMELFNNYMKEMEQRLFDKNRQIDVLKAKLKHSEETRKSNKRQFGVQCQSRVYRWFNGQQQAQKHLPDVQVKALQKENQLMQRQITHLRQNHQNFTQSFEKQIKLRKVEQEYDTMRNHYYRTLTNSPRPSLNKNNNPIMPAPLKLDLKNSSMLNALISPRNNSLSKPPLDHHIPPTSRHHNILLSGIDQKLSKIVSQSICMEGVPLQFDRADARRVRKGRT